MFFVHIEGNGSLYSRVLITLFTRHLCLGSQQYIFESNFILFELRYPNLNLGEIVSVGLTRVSNILQLQTYIVITPYS